MQEFEYRCDKCQEDFIHPAPIGKAPESPECPNSECPGHGTRLTSKEIAINKL